MNLALTVAARKSSRAGGASREAQLGQGLLVSECFVEKGGK